MNWIKTDWISVPAHKNQTTEVAINEWFYQNRSFLLGTPVASQLRGTDGGWAQTMAVAPEPEQDTIALLRDRLNQILETARGDKSKSPQSNNHLPHGDTSMATVIPADKFESNSFYAFILRENPKASGIEVHFPPDCTDNDVLERRWTNSERINLRDRINSGTNGFVSLIEKEGFEQANNNPFLWYTKETDSSGFNRKITKARGWVQKCSGKGAYEIDSDTPVERTKSRRRTGASKPQSPEPTSPTGNKLADALSEAIAPRLAAVLLPQIVEAIGSTVSADEAQQLRNKNRHLEELVEGMKSNLEEADRNYQDAISQRDAALAKAQEMEQAALVLAKEVEKFRNLAVELERDRDALKLTLSEVGLDSSSTPSVEDVTWDDDSGEPEAVTWDEDESSLDKNAPNTPGVSWEEDTGESSSPNPGEPDDTIEEEGFDFDGLGELEG
ncbi:MAG TPA: hypothetical protein V6D33_12350 [Cyanophyceae cyanobacterium]